MAAEIRLDLGGVEKGETGRALDFEEIAQPRSTTAQVFAGEYPGQPKSIVRQVAAGRSPLPLLDLR